MQVISSLEPHLEGIRVSFVMSSRKLAEKLLMPGAYLHMLHTLPRELFMVIVRTHGNLTAAHMHRRRVLHLRWPIKHEDAHRRHGEYARTREHRFRA
jgi:hypothetical protein